MPGKLRFFAGGQWCDSGSSESLPVYNPSTGQVIAETPKCSAAEVSAVVAAAAKAFPAWRDMPVVRRCRILFHCKELLEQNARKIAETLVAENGKTLTEAEGEVRRGIEVVEFAAGMPSLAKGDYIPDIAGRVDGYIYREPLGVVAGACPFNFPAMIPLWMFPVAIACGNTFVLKPSEKCPMTAELLARVFAEGGLPAGVLNIIHGARETFEALITHPEVKAISSVGSTPAARSVWTLAGQHGKRVQALGGAKNYIVVMPDANPAATVDAIISSTYGCAGQRCMASSILVLVGQAEHLLGQVAEAAKALKLGAGSDPSTGMGPVITAASKKRCEDYIARGIADGAKPLLDGRGAKVPGLEGGFFVGPTILDNVRPNTPVACDEIFGPVLAVMRTKDLDEAIILANTSNFGNGASIFTASGGAAREFRTRIECGMIGVNAGVPAPMAMFSFGGHKESLFGDLRAHGPDGIEFYTRKKALIERWFEIGSPGNIWGK